MARRGSRLIFRREPDESAQNQLRQLRDILTTCALGHEKDKPIWMWEKHKRFYVKKPCMLNFAELILKTQ
jgi:hypothetical protein